MGAKHITPEEIVEMHRLYRIHGTYAAVAKEIGRSAERVSFYLQMKNVPNSIRIAIENLSQETK